MEATSKENPKQSLTKVPPLLIQEASGIESNNVSRRYLEFLDHVIENSSRKILGPQKIASYIEDLDPTLTGHITAFS